MRIALVSVVFVSLIAGCAAETAEDGAVGSEQDPTSPSASATPLDVQLQHDYSQAEETLTIDVAAPVPMARFRLSFDGVVAGTTLSIVVLDPSGAEVTRLEVSGTTVAPGATQMKSGEKDTPLAAGAWKVVFTGTAAQGVGRVELTS